METLLFVAAEAREFGGILRRLPQPATLSWPVAFARSIDRGGRKWLLVANGAGTRLAGDAVDVATSRLAVNAMISTGFCGALDPALAPGEVFLADRVVLEEPAASHAALLPAGAEGRRRGALLCADHVVASAEEKEALRRRTGASAVDMESAAVARRAHAAGLPFFCVRVVTDGAGESFGNDFNAARDADGRFRNGRILAAALQRPASRVPELIRLAWRCHGAADRLGGYLAGCRF